MWNPFKRKPKTYTIEANASVPVFDFKGLAAWRKGMWVVVDNKVAILYAFMLPNVEVHFVDSETGLTTETIQVPLTALRQATYSEIPECRRVNFPVELAKEYGYGN